jgi:hypothetical protein
MLHGKIDNRTYDDGVNTQQKLEHPLDIIEGRWIFETRHEIFGHSNGQGPPRRRMDVLFSWAMMAKMVW